MKNSFLVLLIISSVVASAQVQNVSISLGPNLNSIPESRYQHTPTPPIYQGGGVFPPVVFGDERRITYRGKVGLSGAFEFEYKISPGIYVVSGFRGDYFRYSVHEVKNTSEETEVFEGPRIEVSPEPGIPYNFSGIYTPDVPWDAQPQRPFTTLLWDRSLLTPGDKDMRTFLLGVPVLVGTRFLNDKLSVEAGANFSALVTAVAERTMYNYSYEIRDIINPMPGEPTDVIVGIPHPYREKTKGTEGFNTLHVSSLVRSSFKLTKHLDVTASAQLFLTSVYEDYTSRRRSVTTGVRWRW